MDNEFLYYEGIISESELRLHHHSQLSLQLKDLVRFSTFERACERLLANLKFAAHPTTTSHTTLSLCCNLLVNERSLPASTKMGAQVMTTSLALPRHPAAPTPIPTTTTSNFNHQPQPQPQPLLNDLTGAEVAHDMPRHTPAPARSTTTTTSLSLHSHDQQPKGCIAPGMRV
jgi:hypothetical protein